MKRLFNILIIILLLTLIVSRSLIIHGQSNYSQKVNATVKISICGNNQIETGEDCENNNLNNQTCIGLGFKGGELNCDIACTYDTTKCTQTLSSSTDASTQTINNSLNLNSNYSNFNSTSIINLPTTIPTKKLDLPIPLTYYDFENKGKLNVTYLYEIVKLWVHEWKLSLNESQRARIINSSDKKCDINLDSDCNLTDFSVIMFYVDAQ